MSHKLYIRKTFLSSLLLFLGFSLSLIASPAYEWTPDHMQVGVRWQPSVSRPFNNEYELTRPILATHSSYVKIGRAHV